MQTPEVVENQKNKSNKPGTINSVSKGKGKATPKQTTKNPRADPRQEQRPENRKIKCTKCGVEDRHEAADCNSNYCEICHKFFHKTLYCYKNKDGPMYKPENADKTKKENKPASTINSIRHAPRNTTAAANQFSAHSSASQQLIATSSRQYELIDLAAEDIEYETWEVT